MNRPQRIALATMSYATGVLCAIAGGFAFAREANVRGWLDVAEGTIFFWAGYYNLGQLGETKR